MKYEFSAELWKYNGDSPWHFLTIPPEYTKELKSYREPHLNNFGSIKVLAKIGKTTWQTSIFPDNQSGSFLLPVKKEIRKKNDLQEGEIVKFNIQIQTD